MSLLKEGSLRERVKKGKVTPKDAIASLMEARRNGELVNETILRWLRGYMPRPTQEANEESFIKARRREQRKSQRAPWSKRGLKRRAQ